MSVNASLAYGPYLWSNQVLLFVYSHHEWYHIVKGKQELTYPVYLFSSPWWSAAARSIVPDPHHGNCYMAPSGTGERHGRRALHAPVPGEDRRRHRAGVSQRGFP